jgi:alpha-ketoglutarate-dependent taurine dioxygenase
VNETVFIYPGWAMHPVAGRIGAEISGLRLSGDLPDDTVAGLRRALNHRKVLFFRGQNHLDDAEHEAFGRYSAGSSAIRESRRGPVRQRPSNSTLRAAAAGRTIGIPT